MPCVSAAPMLQAALKGHYAVAQININNLESIRALIGAAQSVHAPLMLGVSMGIARQLGGYRTIADVVRNVLDYDRVTIPVCLHADHSAYEAALEALYSGFSSVMFDGSRLPIEENLRLTRQLAELCHARGVSLEAEVGPVAGHEDGGASEGEMADPTECATIASLSVDMLAAGVGNMHGAYPPNWQGLNFPLLQEIRQATGDLPLVLHGGSGVPEDSIRRAIQMGVSKINVNSECREAFTEATRRFFTDGLDAQDAAHMQLITLRPGLEAVKAVAIEKMTLFGCAFKA